MKKPPLIWTNILVFAITGLITLTVIPYYAITVGFDTFEIVATILCLGFCGMSITAGYHRLWSHKTYDAHPILQFIYAIGGAFAIQNSALHWSSDHRIHHKHVDSDHRDPYSASKGFWFSHIGWMLRDYKTNPYENYANARDLQKNKIVMWQHKHYLTLVLVTNFGIPLALGLLNGNVLGMLLSAGVLRLVLSHHFTFFINSLAHIWGTQPYTDENSARDNGMLAFLTYGEGYHNFHHIFEYDYRNGIKWWQFDPTKWFIKSAQWLGLTHNLKVTPEVRIEQAKAQMVLKRSMAHLAKTPNAQVMLEKLQSEYDELVIKLNQYYETQKQILTLKRQKMWKQYEKSELVQQYNELKQTLIQQKKNWMALNAKLVNLPVVN
ncbi:fatty acid desaturase [Flocculibacter collagenilyticus]|uniref:fatty acid desaturase n=1 Tax=Flocculibacter collagenilyticus TaxID=2744479 RepID=UPI0018F4F27E|nr:fatty acid desaturase [Flocculibacter collagenilyticus]